MHVFRSVFPENTKVGESFEVVFHKYDQLVTNMQNDNKWMTE
jgi:hypothetical protein